MRFSTEKAAFGIPGLDDITAGGLARGRLYLLEGSPGTGKTTIATQFLIEGAARGERGLYITLSETDEEFRIGANSHGWDLKGIDVFELIPAEDLLDEQQQQSLLYSSDLELGETTKRIFEAFERIKPSRVVLDSLSEILLLAQSALRYRRQTLALKHYFARNGATVLMLDDLTADTNDKTMHSIAHGVVHLEELTPDYGAERRRARIVKYRGQRYRGGFHDFVIESGGARVFPRLVSAEHKTEFKREAIATQSSELNALLGGGLDRGSSTLILGPAGTGKSLLTLTFILAAVERGERAAMFVFDEELGLLFDRALGLGIDLRAMVDSKQLVVEQVDAAELTPGEFSERVRTCVESYEAKTVVIDSLNGYQAAMPGEQALILHMHELLQYLNRQGGGGGASDAVNPIGVYLGGGINWGSDKAAAGLAVAHARLGAPARQLPIGGALPARAETAIEATARWRLITGLAIQPDIQYIVKPGWNPNIRNALVFAVRLDWIKLIGL